MSEPDGLLTPERLVWMRHVADDPSGHFLVFGAGRVGEALADAVRHIDAQAQQLADSRAQVAVLRETLEALIRGTAPSHTNHWDRTGGSGSGCPECLHVNANREDARAILADTAAAAEAYKRQLRLEGARELSAKGVALFEAEKARDSLEDAFADVLADMEREVG